MRLFFCNLRDLGCLAISEICDLYLISSRNLLVYNFPLSNNIPWHLSIHLSFYISVPSHGRQLLKLAMWCYGRNDMNMQMKYMPSRLSVYWERLTFFFGLFIFVGLQTWHMEVPRLGGSIRSCSCRPMLQPQQHGIPATSVTYTTAHSNARSLTHWERPGIKPTSSWMLVGFTNPWATMGTPRLTFKCHVSATLWK